MIHVFVRWVVLVTETGERHVVATKEEAIRQAKSLGSCEIYPAKFRRKGPHLVEMT